MNKDKNKVKCVYYSCTNQKGDVKIIWFCVPQGANIPTNPPSPRCRDWAQLDAETCDDCKNHIGELSISQDSEEEERF